MSDQKKSLKQIMDFRIEKLDMLNKNGINPYPEKFNVTHNSSEIKEDYPKYEGRAKPFPKRHSKRPGKRQAFARGTSKAICLELTPIKRSKKMEPSFRVLWMYIPSRLMS